MFKAIIHVVETIDDTYGGPARSIPMLCAGLKVNDVYSEVISVDKPDASNALLYEYNIPWLKAKPAKYYPGYYSSELYDLIRERVFSLVDDFGADSVCLQLHSIWSYPSYTVYKICKELELKYIVTPRSSLQLQSLQKKKRLKTILKHLFINSMVNNSFLILVTSACEKDELLVNFSPKNILMLPNGLDFKEFDTLPDKSLSREFFSLNNDSLTLLFFSRVNDRKGLDLLYQAFAALKLEGFKQLKLLIAGPEDDPNILIRIREDALTKGLCSSIFYAGMLKGSDRLKAFSAADIFVLPTKFENFGMSIAEALASNTPVITTKSTPWGLIGELGFGVVIDRDIEKLTDALKKLIEKPITNKKMRSFVEANYDYRNQAKSLIDFITRMGCK